MCSRVLITSALPYANGPLHFGHIAGAYLPADVYARFRRALGDEVLYICGSDEYGIAITLNAERMGLGYQEYVDMYYKMHKETFDKLGISVDFFSRTTNPYHRDVVQDFYIQLDKRGLVEKRASFQLYCEHEERFLADRYVEGTCPKCGFQGARGDECQGCGADYEATDLIAPVSKLSGAELSLRETQHIYFHLERMKEALLAFIEHVGLSDHVRNFVVSYIHDLRPRAITRDLSWGVPVPDFPGKVFYVWFDAPIGYISGTIEWAASVGEPDRWKDFWLESSSEYVQFIGKDNIPFHAVIFPAMELGQDLPYKKVDTLVASEFYLLEGRQFSKSEGNYIDMDAFLEEHGLDKLRYVLSATSPETSDSEFTFADFKTRCNAELIGKFGNFINRVLSFAEKNGCQDLVYCSEEWQDVDEQFICDVRRLADEARACYARYSLRRACSVFMELATLGNVYFNDQAPWKLIKAGQRRRVSTILFCACYCQKVLALISYPILPGSAKAIWEMLSPCSLDRFHEDFVYGLWKEEFFEFRTEAFALQSPRLLFTPVE